MIASDDEVFLPAIISALGFGDFFGGSESNYSCV